MPDKEETKLTIIVSIVVIIVFTFLKLIFKQL